MLPTKLHATIHVNISYCKLQLLLSATSLLHQTNSCLNFTDVPGAPGKPEISDIDATHMTVTWTAPESDGGSRILGYIVERKEGTSTRWVRVNRELMMDLTMMVTGLTERSEYQFRVSAENKAGQGPFSEPSDKKVAKPPYGKFVILQAFSLFCDKFYYNFSAHVFLICPKEGQPAILFRTWTFH